MTSPFNFVNYLVVLFYGLRSFLVISFNSVEQLRDDLMTMLIAGHETTAAVLTWSIFLLAQVCYFLILFLIQSLLNQLCCGDYVIAFANNPNCKIHLCISESIKNEESSGGDRCSAQAGKNNV